jgi:hypothetical protein
MTPEQIENARIGVELMTAWSSSDKSMDLFVERLQLLAEENWADGDQGRAGFLKASLGLADVAGLLLSWFSQKTGHTEAEILQEVGRHFHPHQLRAPMLANRADPGPGNGASLTVTGPPSTALTSRPGQTYTFKT